jgi:hypothetical protein
MAVRLMLTATVVVIASLFGTSSFTLGQEASGSRPAYIQAGSCDALSDVVARLEPLTSSVSEDVGQPGSLPVEHSVTVVPLGLSTLPGSNLAVTISGLAEQSGMIAACGEIADTLNPDGTLSVDLNAIDGSKLSGVAYFSPTSSPEDTQVSVLLVNGNGDGLTPAGAIDGAGVDEANANGANGADGADAVGADARADSVSVSADSVSVDGANGVDGSDGADGADGVAGVSVRGADGADGTDGVDGADGVSVTGQDGRPGHSGQRQDGTRREEADRSG